MHHLLASYTNDLAQDASNVALGAITDQAVNISNGRYQFIQDVQIKAALGLIADGTNLRINTPSLRRITLPSIAPIQAAVAPSDWPPIIYYDEYGPIIEKTEELSLEASRGGAGAGDAFAFLWCQYAKRMAPPGAIYTLRATSTITVAEGAWAAGNITLDQTLPAGRYAVVGMAAYGTNLLAARLIFPNQTPRPGVVAQQAAGQWNDDMMRMGRFGLFGEFVSYAQPMLECIGSGANTAQTVFLDVVKVS